MSSITNNNIIPATMPQWGIGGGKCIIAKWKVPENNGQVPQQPATDVFTKIDQIAKEKAQETSNESIQKRMAVKHLILKGQQILDVRFSQDSIASKTTNRPKEPSMTLDKLMQSITSTWKGAALSCVNMPDDASTSLDNRRLYACKQIVRKFKSDLKMPIDLFPHEMDATRRVENMLKDLSEHELFPCPSEESGIWENTFGHVAFIRMNQGDGYDGSYGYDRDPRVRN